ncbi:MAG TPA: putative toxin-antitoxin system toxin component, PIN family [Candidatus Nanoarchaeia archaeon]|nr:putative toxin-antitoxin system toxin component, PIN family [Candidatus Nanoarchaeia archaeon]
MLKVVLDVNIYISSVFWELGNPHKIVEKALDKKIQVFTSLEILQDVAKVMRRDFNEPKEMITRQISLILAYTYVITPKDVGNVVKDDPDDDMILRCAAGSNADYIVSGDKHLLKLKTFKRAKIITAKELLNTSEIATRTLHPSDRGKRAISERAQEHAPP